MLLSTEQPREQQGGTGRQRPPAPLPAARLPEDAWLLQSWKLPFLKQLRTSSSKTCLVSGSKPVTRVQHKLQFPSAFLLLPKVRGHSQAFSPA